MPVIFKLKSPFSAVIVAKSPSTVLPISVPLLTATSDILPPAVILTRTLLALPLIFIASAPAVVELLVTACKLILPLAFTLVLPENQIPLSVVVTLALISPAVVVRLLSLNKKASTPVTLILTLTLLALTCESCIRSPRLI
ncbi:Uncharacterised protein [Yersinia pekkanenii]|uniref:Uncharacterized protein n=1 Tax=Yersinia pekkanenii TaxID=1288385 RepID=A0A0T9R2P0_9GAMM|nr:Uncharacterised protein [Yersinia pekkanenii]CRY69041.1 Uncharacterised protein [Yersinia pekkanenii]